MSWTAAIYRKIPPPTPKKFRIVCISGELHRTRKWQGETPKPQRTARRGERALTESHEETSRLLEVGANRTRDAAPAVAPPARLRLAIDGSQGAAWPSLAE